MVVVVVTSFVIVIQAMFSATKFNISKVYGCGCYAILNTKHLYIYIYKRRRKHVHDTYHKTAQLCNFREICVYSFHIFTIQIITYTLDHWKFQVEENEKERKSKRRRRTP